jgi:hypothetical protein
VITLVAFAAVESALVALLPIVLIAVGTRIIKSPP